MSPRAGHSAVMFGSGPDFRLVVLFGGQHGGHLSETTLLLLGEHVKETYKYNYVFLSYH